MLLPVDMLKVAPDSIRLPLFLLAVLKTPLMLQLNLLGKSQLVWAMVRNRLLFIVAHAALS